MSQCLDVAADDPRAVLNSLQRDLKKHGAKLQTDLVDLLNREYDGFIGLSSHLIGTSENIDSIMGNLSALRERINTVYLHVESTLNEFESKVEEKRLTTQRHRTLEVLSEIHQIVKKISQLIEQSSKYRAAPGQPPEFARRGSLDLTPRASTASLDSLTIAHLNCNPTDPLTTYTSLLEEAEDCESSDESLPTEVVVMERLARQICRLRVLTSEVAKFELVMKLRPQIDALEKGFFSRLKNAFLESFENEYAEGCSCISLFSPRPPPPPPNLHESIENANHLPRTLQIISVTSTHTYDAKYLLQV